MRRTPTRTSGRPTLAERRRAQRKLFGWSLAVAVLLHVAVFVVAPRFRAEPLIASAGGPLEGRPEPIERPLFLELQFGPPSIAQEDGSIWTEPPERVLAAKRVTEFPRACAALSRTELPPMAGSVRLRVNEFGYTAVVRVVSSTDSQCGDDLIRTVAGDLHYHWLPNARFPAPIDLVQPVSLTFLDL